MIKIFTRAMRLTLVAVGAALLISGCDGAEVRKTRAIERGDHYLATGKLDKARVEFRNALQIAPNDAVSRYKNGVVQERLGNVGEAYQFYQGAIAVNPDHVAARADLARVLLFAGAPAQAMDVLQPGLLKHPDDAGMLTVRAAVRAQLKDVAGAFQDAERAVQLDPKSENAVAVLTGLYNANARSDKAQALLEQGVRDFPAGSELRLALAQLYASLNDEPKAEAMLREVVQLKPDERTHRIRLAHFLASNGHDQAAETSLREAIVALPKDRELKVALLDLLVAKRGPAVAEQQFTKLIAAEPGDVDLRFALAGFYVQRNEPAKAEAVLREVIRREGTAVGGLTARSRLAAQKALQNDIPTAEQLVAEVLAVSPRDTDALTLRGNFRLNTGDAKGAIADLRSVLRDQPNAVGVIRTLARAHLQNGEPALAEETLRRGVEAMPADAGMRLDLGQLLIGAGKPEQAKPMLEQLVKDTPGDVAAQEALYRASAAAKDYPIARAAADAIVAAQPTQGLGHYFRGMLAESQGQTDDAISEYDQALALQPDAAEPIQALTRLLVARKRIPEALRRLDALAARSPTSGVPLSLKGEVLSSEHRYADATVAFQRAIERAPKWWAPYGGLGYVALAKGDRAGAIATLSAAIPTVTEPNKVRAQLATIYESGGQADQAIGVYEDMSKLAPQDAVVANNLAMLLVTYRRDAASLGRATELVKPFADSASPRFLDTYGWVRFKRGDVTGALPALAKAQAAEPGSVDLLYHLGMAQAAAGQNAQATESLKQALAGGAIFAGANEARAAIDRIASAK